MRIIQPQIPREYQMERKHSVRNLRKFRNMLFDTHLEFPKMKTRIFGRMKKVCLECTRKLSLPQIFQLITAGKETGQTSYDNMK